MCRTILAAVACCALPLLAPATASAHATLLRSDPGAGAVLNASPAQLTASFSEPLNPKLSKLTLTGPDGKVIRAHKLSTGTQELLLRPASELAQGVYQVHWHSVSADDGHVLDGSYYFGVQSAAPAGARESQGGPLAGSGWPRALLRGAFDGALLIFCGGVFNAMLLARGRKPAAWLLPGATNSSGTETVAGVVAGRVERLWSRTLLVGCVAVLAAVASTLTEAATAGQGLSGTALHAFLLVDLSGQARLTLVAALALAVLCAARGMIRVSAGLAVLALTALAFSGHADSAHPRAVALGSDLAHLIAAAVWLGGITLIALAWLPHIAKLDQHARRVVMRDVLARFGRVALPAVLALAAFGAVNAIIELGSLTALWEQSYGQVLIVKVVLVAGILAASYLHAIRIRPRLLRAGLDGPVADRRHWRLLAAEPLLAGGVVLAAAVLVALAPPNRPSGRAGAVQAAHPAPPPPTAHIATDQLAVAEQAGPYIVAAWVTHTGSGVKVQTRTLTSSEQPVDITSSILGAVSTTGCGVGCREAQLQVAPAVLTVRAGRYTARLPIRWRPGGDALARRLLKTVEVGQLELRDVRIHEILRGGPGTPNLTDYRLAAPDRFAFRISRGPHPVGDTIITGNREWQRSSGQRSWQESSYGGSTRPFDAKSYLGWWTPYARRPRLMRLHQRADGEIADIATIAEIEGVGAVWLRLRLDVTHRRLLRLRMITAGHFMTQVWSAFDRPLQIQPPPATVTQRE
jgi:copper transport protein